MEYTTFLTDAVRLKQNLNDYATQGWFLDTITALHNDRLLIVMSREKSLTHRA